MKARPHSSNQKSVGACFGRIQGKGRHLTGHTGTYITIYVVAKGALEGKSDADTPRFWRFFCESSIVDCQTCETCAILPITDATSDCWDSYRSLGD